LWNRTRRTVSHEGADLELDVLANGMPVKESRVKEKICADFDVPYVAGSSINGGLKLTCNSRRQANVEGIAIIGHGADQSMDRPES